jgi:WD40 repeat protein
MAFLVLISFCQVWDPKRDFRLVQTLTGHKGEISALCVNSKYLISGSFDKTIKVSGQ